MRPHDRPLLRGEGARLEEDLVWDADLPDVVEQGTELERLEAVGLELEALPYLEGHVRDPAGVRRRVLVLGFEGVGQRLDGR